MNSRISRRLVIPLALLAVALWAGPTLAANETFQVQLSGAQQVPAVQTDGTGTANLSYNPTTRRLRWDITYSGLSGPVMMAHMHGPAAAGSNAGVQIWLTKKGSKVESPIKGAAKLTAAQAKQFEAGQWYINVHTRAHPGGELRGQVTPPSG
ncbi:MAG: CHRD domain-containing protein [Steroidobacteraceae bacterium]